MNSIFLLSIHQNSRQTFWNALLFNAHWKQLCPMRRVLAEWNKVMKPWHVYPLGRRHGHLLLILILIVLYLAQNFIELQSQGKNFHYLKIFPIQCFPDYCFQTLFFFIMKVSTYLHISPRNEAQNKWSIWNNVGIVLWSRNKKFINSEQTQNNHAVNGSRLTISIMVWS